MSFSENINQEYFSKRYLKKKIPQTFLLIHREI